MFFKSLKSRCRHHSRSHHGPGAHDDILQLPFDQLLGVWGDEFFRYMQTRPCPTCNGSRLRPETLAIKVDGVDIAEFCSWPIDQSLKWIQSRQFSAMQKIIATPLLRELLHRLGFLVSVGLDYISLGRNMSTLSGGEAQRIWLAGQFGSGLVGVSVDRKSVV